ncbi:LysR substrate-binding domain-containing protein [Nocardia goodfellowii]|uniref:DNA-binding transcriptional LysR family regulator n=1 Tax=Nocardia goodfellowii TaxID=882446 RepID=A0ABS4QG58_9NOCA|nr:LysR family transcriptional regulator [Nocardia goodfellowii]MBP2190073.1 DNA-binding transcriptional LysR family regulator [Nocardia goodfellowii]
MIDPRLQTLRMLREHGTVTAAAAALHLTPSTVSQQLRQLAHDLDVVLLEQVGRRVQLTAAAHTLLRHADDLFARAELARADVAAHRDDLAGVLRISAMPTAMVALVAPAAARLRAEHPRLALEINEDESRHCFDLLLSGETDIGVVIPAADGPSPADPRFEQHPLADEPQDLLVPVGHRLADCASVELAAAAAEDWIGAPERVAHCQLQLSACAAAGFTPRVVHRGMDWIGISALVTRGFGVSLIPRLAYLPAEHDVVRVRLHGPSAPSRRHVAFVRRGSSTHPSIAAGLAAVRAICRERTDITAVVI